MQQLTSQGLQSVQNIAQRYNLSVDGTIAMLNAVNAGGGTMAQFYVPELGGGGQWMQGGMTMVGDMFNTGLQNTVASLCGELSNLLMNQQVYAPLPANQSGGFNNSNSWWPSELGQPNSSGGQNDTQYAYFANARRLAIRAGDTVTVYDTVDHQIGGVQQQSGQFQPLSFSSQFGTFDVSSLPLADSGQVSDQMVNVPNIAPASVMEPVHAPQPITQPESIKQPAAEPAPQPKNELSSDAIFKALEQLGQLHQQGVLSQVEFEGKKADLLSRL